MRAMIVSPATSRCPHRSGLRGEAPEVMAPADTYSLNRTRLKLHPADNSLILRPQVSKAQTCRNLCIIPIPFLA
jgi:hypothetical protein